MNEIKNSHLMTDEQRLMRDARIRLAQEVAALLSTEDPQGSMIATTMSNIDLMEALYVAYDTGIVTDSYGDPMPFAQIVRSVCQILDRPIPSNPYDCARRGQRRKGVLRSNFITRYAKRMNADK
jgi:RNA polymerase-interacting CarD/CdnL/TRCF family regulator